MVQSPLPYVGASWPVPWIRVLQDIEGEPARTVVPGHGPLMHDMSYLRQVRALLEAGNAAARSAALEGHPLEWLQDSVHLDDVRRATPVWQDSTLDEDWRQSVRVLLDRSWRGVRGQG